MIIALTGEKLAGKGTVTAYIQEHHHGQSIRFSQVLSDILICLHRPNTRAELVQLGAGLRQIYGNDILAQVVHDRLADQSAGLWVIDGMRYVREYEVLSTLPQFYLLNITANLDVRYQRTKNRLEKSDEANMSLVEFTQREHDATEREIPLLQKRASQTIHNNAGLEELYQTLEQWLASHPG